MRSARFLYQLLSFLIGLPGIAAIALGIWLWRVGGYEMWVWIAFAGGYVLVWGGVVFAVLHRKYNPAWMLLGLASILGLFVVVALPDDKGRRLRRAEVLLQAKKQRDRELEEVRGED